LLELVMFHRTAVDSLDNYIFELIDYCYRKLIALLKKFIHKDLFDCSKFQGNKIV